MTDEFSIALAQAADSYDFNGIAFLVRQGASANARLDEDTLLTWSVRQGQGGLARMLLEAGADADLADVKGNTPLIHAARLGMQDIVEMLIEADADPFRRNANGKSAYEAALFAKKDLQNDAFDPNADTSSIESQHGRLTRIALMLEEAEAARAEKNEIASCHEGTPAEFTIRPPLKLIRPGTP